MTDYVREARLKKKREYYREWRKRNPDTVRASQIRYWTKKAEEQKANISECRSKNIEVN